MDKKQRVKAALRGEPVDRIPASFWFHFPHEQASGAPMAAAHLAYYRQADPDFLKVMNDNGYPAPEGGIHTPADWRKLRLPPLSAAPFQAQLEGLKRIVDAIGHETLIITTIFNPYSVGNNLSDHQVTAHMAADPQAVGAGLAVIAEGQALLAQACLDAGADGIYFSAQGGEADRFDREAFERYIKSSDVKVLEAVRDRATFNLLHICAHNVRLDEYAGYPAHAVNWSTQWENLSLAEGWKLFDMALVGGMDQRGPLVDGSPAQIAAEAAAAVAEVGRRRFILGAGCTLPNDINVANIRLAIEAAHAL